MVTERELVGEVDGRFDPAARGLAAWPDPNPERNPPDEAYSRLSDPGKWSIVGVRADAWIDALGGLGLAVVDDVAWARDDGPVVRSARRLVPVADGAIPLVIARTAIWGDDADIRGEGVLLGVGEPAVALERVPDCGCDACDSGSQDALDGLDDEVLAVVTGVFRHLVRPGRHRVFPVGRLVEQSITVRRGGYSASNLPRRHGWVDIRRVLADPTGWVETSGASWLTPDA